MSTPISRARRRTDGAAGASGLPPCSSRISREPIAALGASAAFGVSAGCRPSTGSGRPEPVEGRCGIDTTFCSSGLACSWGFALSWGFVCSWGLACSRGTDCLGLLGWRRRILSLTLCRSGRLRLLRLRFRLRRGSAVACPGACPSSVEGSSTVSTTAPTLTLSPFLILRSLTTPATDEGTSIVALSVSSSRTGWSIAIVSPTLTSTRVTSPPATFSPSSGTLNSVNLSTPVFGLRSTGWTEVRSP